MYPRSPDDRPSARQRAAARCFAWWPLAMGGCWWLMLFAAWEFYADEFYYDGIVTMMGYLCSAAAYGFVFYLTVALPVFVLRRRRRRARWVPVATSVLYVGATAFSFGIFAIVFALFVAAMLCWELSDDPVRLTRRARAVLAPLFRPVRWLYRKLREVFVLP